MDLAQETELATAIANAVKTYGRLDHAVNCAGIDIAAELLAYTATDFDCIFDVIFHTFEVKVSTVLDVLARRNARIGVTGRVDRKPRN
jgi:NAD(P)-dependent dehydrogenase (short-subunit alcohol dehydrogenase family)